MILFPFVEYWSFYAIFIALVVLLLALDLGVFHRTSHEVSFKESLTWTIVWISLAFIFNLFLYQYTLNTLADQPVFLTFNQTNAPTEAKRIALEFLTGFVVEKSLAIDNIFIFAMVFSYFGIPKIYQHRILFWGILGALVFRAAFIAMGSVLMEYKAIVIFFGGLLILTGIKMFFAGTKEQSLENNFVVLQLKRIFNVSPQIEGDRFFITKKGVRYVTPLFLALMFIEVTDIIFALDSVPAIFALTKEPLIVFTSNIFAILGLRSMYFMIAGVLYRFIYIKYGLAAVLVFVGAKMTFLNELYGGKFPIGLSLTIIASLIGLSVLASLIWGAKRGQAV